MTTTDATATTTATAPAHLADRVPAPPPARTGRLVSTVAAAMSRLASWRVWLSSAVVYGLFAGAFFASSAPFAIPHVEALCGQAPPDVRFTSSGAEVSGFLASCGVAGREAYRTMQLADLLYPTVFALFVASSLALVISRLAPRRPSLLALAALPLLASGFDYLENACAWWALATFPEPGASASLLGVASAAKSATSWAAGLLLLASLGALGVATVVRRHRSHATGSGDPSASR